MDIQVASNFERFLYYHFEQDSDRLVTHAEFTATGSASIGVLELGLIAGSEQRKLAAMREVNQSLITC